MTEKTISGFTRGEDLSDVEEPPTVNVAPSTVDDTVSDAPSRAFTTNGGRTYAQIDDRDEYGRPCCGSIPKEPVNWADDRISEGTPYLSEGDDSTNTEDLDDPDIFGLNMDDPQNYTFPVAHSK